MRRIREVATEGDVNLARAWVEIGLVFVVGNGARKEDASRAASQARTRGSSQ